MKSSIAENNLLKYRWGGQLVDSVTFAYIRTSGKELTHQGYTPRNVSCCMI